MTIYIVLRRSAASLVGTFVHTVHLDEAQAWEEVHKQRDREADGGHWSVVPRTVSS